MFNINFEPRTSGVGSDRSTNWATANAMVLSIVKARKLTKEYVEDHLCIMEVTILAKF